MKEVSFNPDNKVNGNDKTAMIDTNFAISFDLYWKIDMNKHSLG